MAILHSNYLCIYTVMLLYYNGTLGCVLAKKVYYSYEAEEMEDRFSPLPTVPFITQVCERVINHLQGPL